MIKEYLEWLRQTGATWGELHGYRVGPFPSKDQWALCESLLSLLYGEEPTYYAHSKLNVRELEMKAKQTRAAHR